jgi:hypothetical protein
MNYLIKKISYVILALALIVSVAPHFTPTVEASGCTITSGKFYNYPENFNNKDILNAAKPDAFIRIISTGDCTGWQGMITLKKINTVFDDPLPMPKIAFDFKGSPTDVELHVGEMGCDSNQTPNCLIGALIEPFRGLPNGQNNYGAPFDIKNIQNQTYNYNCKHTNACTNDIQWLPVKTSNVQQCIVTGLKWIPSGDQEKLLSSGANPSVDALITMTGCSGQKIDLDVVELDQTPDQTVFTTSITPQGDIPSYTVHLYPGETGCFEMDPFCNYYLKTTVQPTNAAPIYFSSEDKPAGDLKYHCIGACDQPWSDKPGETNPTDLSGNPGIGTAPDQIYSGLSEALGKSFNIKTDSLGSFLNSIIAFVIGIAGVFTVGAIMYDGFSYWQAEKEGSTTGVSKVKGRVWKRLLGLLLLFTMYTLLRTINPDLLNLTPRIDLATLTGDQAIALSEEGYDIKDQKNAPTKQQLQDAVNKYNTKSAYINNEYIPARDRAIGNASKGIKLMATVHAIQEGFYPVNSNGKLVGTRSYINHNPGNIGNTDKSNTAAEQNVTYPTLEDGIRAQATYINKVASNQHGAYKLGAHIQSPEQLSSGSYVSSN